MALVFRARPDSVLLLSKMGCFDVPEKKYFSFVLMPFDKEFDDIYKLGIQAAANKMGVVAERVDEQIYTETILERIYQQIDSADFIVADMTGRNPNVFYEVGYAHAKGKPCILITQKADDIPFDLKHHRHLIYDGSISTLKEQLEAEIGWVKHEIDTKSEAKFEVTARPIGELLTKTDYSRTGSFELLIDIHNLTSQRSAEIDALYLFTSDRWQIKQDGKKCGSKKSGRPEVEKQHLLSVPSNRLAPGSWTQVRCELSASLWTKWIDTGVEPRDEYRIQGYAEAEIVTSEGTLSERFDLDVQFDEIPF